MARTLFGGPAQGFSDASIFRRTIDLCDQDDYSIRAFSTRSLRERPLQTSDLQAGLATIGAFGKLEEDWDGYGAVRISADVLSNASSVLTQLLFAVPKPDIVPNPNGTISFEWESQVGYAHLEIGASRFALVIKPVVGATTLADGSIGSVNTSLAYAIAAIIYPARNTAPSITRIQIDTSRTALA